MNVYPIDLMGLDLVLALGAGWLVLMVLTIFAQSMHRMLTGRDAGDRARHDLPGHAGA